MNRIDRLTAILIQLQTKKWITASEVGERFGICLRTVYRDIRALEEAGIPIGAEAGKGYYIVDGYHLPPVMFTREEAGSMLIAEKLVEKLTDNSVRKQFISAVSKIKAILPYSEKEFVDSLNTKVEVFDNPVSERSEYPNNFITSIQKALVGNKCLLIDYFSQYSKHCNKNRIIDPLGLVYYSNSWHLIAHCRLRNAMRDFRVDRISKMEITQECTREKKPHQLKEYFMKAWQKGTLLEVTVWFDNVVVSGIGATKYYFGYVDEKISGNGVEMNFAVTDYNYIARWLLPFEDNIKIVRPVELEIIMTETVHRLSAIYNSRKLKARSSL